jgi:hypothetical protein
MKLERLALHGRLMVDDVRVTKTHLGGSRTALPVPSSSASLGNLPIWIWLHSGSELLTMSNIELHAKGQHVLY